MGYLSYDHKQNGNISVLKEELKMKSSVDEVKKVMDRVKLLETTLQRAIVTITQERLQLKREDID